MTEPVDPGDGAEVEDEAVRRLLAGLPEVTPPDGFFDDLIRARRRRARIIAGAGLAAAGVAGAVVVAHVTGITGRVDPEMALLADRHATIVAVDVEVPGQMPGDELPAPYQAPAELGGMRRGMAVFHPDDVVQVVYGDDGNYLSVFEQAGDLDDGAMEGDVSPVAAPGVDAWRTEDGSAVIVRRSDVVYVLMGDVAELSPETLAAIVAELPEARRMGLARRIGDAMDDLVAAFSLD
jgi:hypothetical protein